uniref:Uncharacterized protein n=1 Tax=Timema genevievae TaxID=629358 RepID=A0A7R9JZG6_TIMGE|nr:unnamed protein product [Timema genevievae]
MIKYGFQKRRLTLNGQRDLQSFISDGGSCKPSVSWSLAATTSCVYKGVRAYPPVAYIPHSRPLFLINSTLRNKIGDVPGHCNTQFGNPWLNQSKYNSVNLFDGNLMLQS